MLMGLYDSCDIAVTHGDIAVTHVDMTHVIQLDSCDSRMTQMTNYAHF